MMVVLSIDYGEKRIGLAYGDTEIGIALPLTVIHNSDTVWDELCEVIITHEIEHILLGFPQNLSKEDTPQTKYVKTFGDTLQKSLPCSMEYWDETYTSQLARQYLPKKQSIDVESARILLEEYMQQ
jgi:putative Holliday junction resolvase